MPFEETKGLAAEQNPLCADNENQSDSSVPIDVKIVQDGNSETFKCAPSAVTADNS